MKDNEIIKALECLKGSEMLCACCAYAGRKMPQCRQYAAQDAIDLINRRKAEIDDLKRDTIPKLCTAIRRANRYGVDADKENERLKAEIARLEDILRCQADGIVELNCQVAQAKSSAVKDFAEKLKSECNGIISNDWNHKAQPVSWAAAYEDFIEDIDRLLNEMVGDTK